MIWQEGTTGWISADTVPGLFEKGTEKSAPNEQPQPIAVSQLPQSKAEGLRQIFLSNAALMPCQTCSGKVAKTAFACPHCGAVLPPLVNELERARKVYAFLLGWCVPLLIIIGSYAYIRDASNHFVTVLLCIGVMSMVAKVGQMVGYQYLWRALFDRR
jgi:predicted RNA-binding Zn-ribbon protein involved in translation (DUF1610 family)